MSINNIFSKKPVLILSAIYVILLACFYFFDFESYCHMNDWCRHNLIGYAENFFIMGFPLVPVFIMSLLTYKMNDRVFKAWRLFALLAVPLNAWFNFANANRPIHGINVGGFSIILAGCSAILILVISLIIVGVKLVQGDKKPAAKMKR